MGSYLFLLSNGRVELGRKLEVEKHISQRFEQTGEDPGMPENVVFSTKSARFSAKKLTIFSAFFPVDFPMYVEG